MTELDQKPRKRLFAHMDSFPTDWNDEGEAVLLGQKGSNLLAVGWFGAIKLDMEDSRGIAECLEQTRAFADAVEAKYQQFVKEQESNGHADGAKEK